MPPPSEAGLASRLAAVEGGGTKFLAAVRAGDETLAETRIETSSPEATLAGVLRFLKPHGVDAVGVACFGPLDLDPGSPNRGRLRSTPKPGWSGADVAGVLARGLGAPVALETDVLAAAVAEQLHGAGVGSRLLLYITAGTGIGGAAAHLGRPLRGAFHAELGHLPAPALDDFPGVCPFHARCYEGVASGAALRSRLGGDPRDLPEGDPMAALMGRYLAHLVHDATLALAPDRVVLGGGVGLRGDVRAALAATLEPLLSQYPVGPEGRERAAYLVAPALSDAGLEGAFVLAARLARGELRPIARPDPR